MKFKKTMLMAFLLLSILAIGAVSAADGNQTADVQAVEGDTYEIGLNSSDALSVADDDVLGVEPGTFAELQIEIEASDHSLMLGKDYEGDGGFISIAKSNFLLDGNGYTLDAKGGGVFSIVGNNVQIRNLNIVNASYNHYNMSAGGAAINVYGNDCAIVNCIMTDFSSYSDWGALYVMGDGFSLANCVLSHNSPTDEGAAVLINGNNATIIGTNFTSCGGTTNSGGAIVILGNGSKIQYCLINDSSSSSNGGAIYLEGYDAIINDVSIVNSSVSGKGGAIYLKGKSGQVTYSHFENCSAEYGGAVAVEGDSCIINQCGFSNSTSQSDGGALYVEGDEFVLANSVFSFNCALDDGGALSINGNNATIELNEFTSNSATGGEGTPRGGAIMMVGDDNKISLTFFTSNSAAVSGGAVFAVGNRIRIYDSFFEKNNCSNKKSMGGSIYLLGNFSEISSWFYNSTANNGGAVYVNGSGNSIRNSSFIFCVSTLYGGAIYVYGNHTVIDNSKFTNNTISTPNEHYGGGAICFEGDMANVTNSNFTGNGIGTYGTGGAILMYASSYSDLIENCTFSYNNAQFGGAIRWMYSIENVIRNCTFIGNRAEKGGAINWQHCNNDTIDSCTFLDNTAVKNGAALLLGSGEEGNHVFNIINSSFEGNEGNFSGDISVLKVNGVSIVGCNFTNSKSGYGGAIALKGTGASGTMIFGCRFANVSSDTISRLIHDGSYSGGGAVFVEFNSVEVDSCVFSNCSSTGDGGAIKWLGNRGRINATTFNDCFSANNGGAVYSAGEVYIANSTFTSNRADNGGAVYGTNSTLITASEFIGNAADNLGGAIYNCTHENCVVEGDGSQIYPDNRTAPAIEITVDVIGDTAVIHVALPGDVEGNVTVAINGINQTLNLVNGVGNITLTGLAKGTFEVTVTFDGNDMYLKTANSTSFTVSKETPALTINVDNMKPNESQTITVQLPDSATGNVTFHLYYEGLIFIEKSCELSESAFTPFKWAMIEVNDLPIGSYSITVAYGGDDSYLETSDYALFTVSPRINMTNEIIKGDNLEIAIDFGNLTDMTISGEVNVYIDGEKYAFLRISGSRLNFLISTEDIPLESHSVVLQYGGTTFSEDIFRLGAGKSYVPMAYEVHISPREIFIPPKLISDDVGDVVFEMPVDSVGMLAISLDTGESVAIINLSNYANRTDAFEETVSSVLADCEVTIKKTEDDRLIITMTFSQRKGEIGVVLEYTGDGKYSPFRKVATASVNHRNPVIIAGDLSMIYSSNRVYSVVVYGSDGKAAGGVEVSFMVNGRLIGSVFTNANGVAGIKITNAPGSYSITAKALGTGATKRLTVSHVLSLKTVKVKKSAKKLVLKATLKKVNGKYLKGKKITFKFNGKTYKAKTNKKGVAKVTIKKAVLKKLKAGKKIKYQATYLKDTVKKTVKVKK